MGNPGIIILIIAEIGFFAIFFEKNMFFSDIRQQRFLIDYFLLSIYYWSGVAIDRR